MKKNTLSKKWLLALASVFTLNLNAQVNLTNGLVASYPFTTTTVAGSGTADVSGKGNNGVISGSVTPAPDRFGTPNSAYSFNGINGRINIISTFTGFTTLTGISISYWFYIPSTSGNGNTVYPEIAEFYNNVADAGSYSSAFVAGNYIRPSLGISPSNIYCIVNNQTGSQKNCFTGDVYGTNTWYHVVSTYDNSSFVLKNYINGNFIVTSTAGTTMRSINSLIIGSAHETAFYNFFAGYIDDIKIYNRVLNQCEVNVLYNGLPAQPVMATTPGTSLCTNNNYTLAVTSVAGLTYQWAATNGTPSSQTGSSASFKWTSSGTDVITITAFNSCSVSGVPLLYPVTVTGASPTITGPSQICTNVPSYYSVGSQASITFKWGLTGPGTINNAIVNLATVTGTAPGILQLVVTAVGTTCTVTSPVYSVTVTSPFATPPNSFSGPDAICNGSSAVYSQVITFTGSFPNVFTWSVSNSNASLLGYSTYFVSYNPSTMVTTLINAATIQGVNYGTVQLNIYQSAYAGACPSAPTSKIITITGAPPTITGPSSISVCSSLPGIYSMVSVSGQTYSWSISGANGSLLYSNNVASLTGISGNGITLTGITAGLCPSSVNKYIPFTYCCGAPSYPATLSGAVTGTNVYSGTYYVGSDLQFNGGSQTFAAGTQFYVAPTVTITFFNGAVANIISTKFTAASCSTMWGGILTGDNNVLNFNGSELSNSEQGLNDNPFASTNVYTLTVTNSVFNNNYNQHIAIRAGNSLSGINNSTFTGNPLTMLAPYNYVSSTVNYYTKVGIKAIKYPIISNCSFNNCLIGVANTDWDYLTDLSISGSTFKNCFVSGIAQYTNNSNISTNNISVPGLLSNVQMPFSTYIFGNFSSSINYGIYSVNYNPYVLTSDVIKLTGNTISGNNVGTQTGVYLETCQANVSSNYLINLYKGVEEKISRGSVDATTYSYYSTLNVTANLFKDCNNSLIIRMDGGGLGGETDAPAYLPINCNGFTKTVSFTGTTLGIIIADGADNHTQNIGASTTNPAGNKFSSGFNKPLVMNDGTVTTWTYYTATDENTGGTVYGSSPAKLSINTGSTKTVFQACGYNPPARAEAFEESAKANASNDVTVYPNPFSDELNLQFNSEEGKEYAIEITSSIGTSVYSKTVKASGAITKIVINNPLSTGMYILRVTDGNITKVVKVIKK